MTKFLHALATVIGALVLVFTLGGALGAWDFHVCLGAPEGVCSRTK